MLEQEFDQSNSYTKICCALLCVHSSFAIILIGKRELVALLYLSSWCLLILVWLFLTMPQAFLKFVIVVFPDHTHYFGKRAKSVHKCKPTRRQAILVILHYPFCCLVIWVLSGPLGFTCWISFAPVFSLIYC